MYTRILYINATARVCPTGAALPRLHRWRARSRHRRHWRDRLDRHLRSLQLHWIGLQFVVPRFRLELVPAVHRSVRELRDDRQSLAVGAHPGRLPNSAAGESHTHLLAQSLPSPLHHEEDASHDRDEAEHSADSSADRGSLAEASSSARGGACDRCDQPLARWTPVRRLKAVGLCRLDYRRRSDLDGRGGHGVGHSGLHGRRCAAQRIRKQRRLQEAQVDFVELILAVLVFSVATPGGCPAPALLPPHQTGLAPAPARRIWNGSQFTA